MNQVTFGTTSKGEEGMLYTISNGKGMELSATNYGATVVKLIVPDKNGNSVDVALGYDQVEDYEREGCYFGATVARNANRIANAKVTIDGVTYNLEANDNENNLHSGANGASDKLWALEKQTENCLVFTYVSADMEQGFPGNCNMKVTYTLTEDNALEISYDMVSDKKTVMNPTNHTYFNMNGHAAGTVYGHKLWLKASHFTPVASGHAIPTGELAPVAGTPFDFTSEKAIGQDIEKQDTQLGYGCGYDHNFAIDKDVDGLEKVASVVGDETGIRMDVLTDLPGIQFYSANFIDGQKGKGGCLHVKRGALCLETQYFPNAVNEPNFATPIFDAGVHFESKTVYAFSAE